MRRFLSTWLVMIVIGVFALVMLVAAPMLNNRAKQAATADLNELLDALETKLSSAATEAEAVTAGAQSNILSKTRAVSRFLAHDDALLQTDALVSMCELLEIAAVDVTDYAGTVVASSVAGRIGRSLTGEPATAWTKEVLDGEGVERTRADSNEPALLWGCVLRSDTEGFVLTQTLDRSILTAQALSDPQTILSGFSFVQDTLEISTESGSDNTYEANGRLYVRRTHTLQDDAGKIALLASRALGSVNVSRNIALLVLSLTMLACILLALLIQFYLLGGACNRLTQRKQNRRQSKLPELPAQDIPDAEESATLKPAAQLPAQDIPDGEDARAKTGVSSDRHADKPSRMKEKHKKKPRAKLFEFVPVEPDEQDDLPPQDIPDADLVATILPGAKLPPQDIPDGELVATRLSASELPPQDVPDGEFAATRLSAAELPPQDIPDGENAVSRRKRPRGKNPVFGDEPALFAPDDEPPVNAERDKKVRREKAEKKPKRPSRKQRANDEALALADSVFEKIID